MRTAEISTTKTDLDPLKGPEFRPRPRALKVLHVINSMSLGGTEKVLLKLATRLTDGFEHRICCIRGFDPNLVQSFLRPEQLMALDLRSSRFSFFVPALARAIRSCNPDIVHSRNWGAIEAVLAARLVRVPAIIHSEHGYEVETLSRIPLRQRWMHRLAWSLADAVFTVSRELRDFHAQQAGIRAGRIRVLCNGVDTQKFAPDPAIRARIRSQLGISSSDFVIGAVGRIVPIKDYDTLIRAAAILAAKPLSFKLVMVGDGPDLARLRELARNLLGDESRFLALGKRDDIPALLNAMDVFVQTSLREGMSNTVLEAMASGLPPVVTRVGGNPEIVNDDQCGWLFKPRDVEHLAQLLNMLASDRALGNKMGQAARYRVQEQFSDEAMIDNYRRLYHELSSPSEAVPSLDISHSGVSRV